jgi:hypothetical protein
MKKNILQFTLALGLIANLSFSQSQKTELGTPSAIINSNRSNPLSVQNGTQTLNTSYTSTACGLNYTQGSVKLGQRGTIGGAVQPATVSVTGIPASATIIKAFLYADASGTGIAINATLVNPLLASNVFSMSIIGLGPDKCWSYGASYSYRADITSAISGNGTYTLSGLPTGSPNDVDGATILVIYSDPSQSYTGHIVIGDGMHEVSGGTTVDILTGFSACATSTFANAFMIVSDLQAINITTFNMNGSATNQLLNAQQVYWNFVQISCPNVSMSQSNTQFVATNSSDCFAAIAAGLYYRTNCSACCAPLSVSVAASSSCSAGSATATAFGGVGPYSYTWSPTGGNSSSISGVAPGNYTVSVSDGSCSVGMATVNISGSSSGSVVAATSNSFVCLGQTATLTATGATSYTWSTGATGPVAIVTPSASGNYQVIGSNGSCTDTANVFVLVSLCTGVTQSATNGNGYAVFPNPNNGNFVLMGKQTPENSSLEIYNAIGQKIYHSEIKSIHSEIDLSKEANGLYYLKVIKDGKAQFYMKVCKNQ